MATVRYRIRSASSSKESSVYLRFNQGRGVNLEVKTGFTISKSLWSDANKMPKQTTPETKILFRDLKKLETFVYQAHNDAQAKGEQLTKGWLERAIVDCFKRKEVSGSPGVTEHIQYIIDNAETKRIPGRNTLGLSKGRVTSYRSFMKNLEAFEKNQRRKLHFLELDNQLQDRYRNWLLVTKQFSKNYAGKQLDNLRAVVNDAIQRGVEVHPHALKIESFTESNEERMIITLNVEELKKIRDTEMPNNYLENAKKWLLIGCELGQRAGDLLSITPSDIRIANDYFFIDLVQQKTKKEVTIPVASKYIQNVLKDDFPYPISGQKLNKYIKRVCEIAGIDEVVEGKILDKVSNRKVSGKYPKFLLITSHCFRRSFATNYYKKIATPILMTITGHGKESMFLKYINRQEDKDENAKLFMKYYNEMNSK